MQIALGAAAGTAARVWYKVDWSTEQTTRILREMATITPAFFALPIAGAWIAATYVAPMNYSIPVWAWAAVGANVADMLFEESYMAWLQKQMTESLTKRT